MGCEMEVTLYDSVARLRCRFRVTHFVHSVPCAVPRVCSLVHMVPMAEKYRPELGVEPRVSRLTYEHSPNLAIQVLDNSAR